LGGIEKYLPDLRWNERRGIGRKVSQGEGKGGMSIKEALV